MTAPYRPPVVAVVGGGAAGTLAAVAAARAGASVSVIRRGAGATAWSSGAVDVAEHQALARHEAAGPLAAGLPWQEAARAIAGLLPNHPYARVPACLDVLPQALELLATVAVGANLVGREDGRNLVLPSVLGTVKRTALTQRTIVASDLGALRAGARVLVVRWPESFHGDGHHVALVLSELVRRQGGSLVIETLDVSGVLEADDVLRPPLEQARRLDDPAARSRLVDAVAFALKGAGPADLLLLPPITGLEESGPLVDAVAKRSGMAVAETLSVPPSVPGQRLQMALERGLIAEKVHAQEWRVIGVNTQGMRVTHLEAEKPGGDVITMAVDALVLCTGRFLSGGLVRQGTFTEPLLDLPLFLDGQPVERGFVGTAVAELPESEQPFMRVGVMTDNHLQPVDAHGRRVLENLFVAGSILAGCDVTRGQGGVGLAAVTGMLAGRHAAAVTPVEPEFGTWADG